MKRRSIDPNSNAENRFLQICDSKTSSEYHLTCYSRFCNDIFDKKNLVSCTKCRKCYHSDCNSPPLVYDIIIRYPWHCDKCKECVLCGDDTDKDRTLLMCDACDRGFHMDCIPEILDDIPEGKWFCDDCRYCKVCDLKLSDKDALNNYYSLEGNKLCKRCMDERSDGEIFEVKNYKDYCSVCSRKINSLKISNNVVICKKCARGSHIECSRRENEDLVLQSQMENWICNTCYKIHISQVCFD